MPPATSIIRLDNYLLRLIFEAISNETTMAVVCSDFRVILVFLHAPCISYPPSTYRGEFMGGSRSTAAEYLEVSMRYCTARLGAYGVSKESVVRVLVDKLFRNSLFCADNIYTFADFLYQGVGFSLQPNTTVEEFLVKMWNDFQCGELLLRHDFQFVHSYCTFVYTIRNICSTSYKVQSGFTENKVSYTDCIYFLEKIERAALEDV